MSEFFKKNLTKFVVSLSVVFLCAFICAVTIGSISRYFFDAGSVKLDDFISYSFAVLILLSVVVSFYRDRHVRVDAIRVFNRIIESRFLRFLSAIPFLAIAVLSLPALQFSWSIYEGSREVNGLGGLFLVKTLLPISFILIVIFLCLNHKDNKQ